jgi:hypothetical protein
MALASGSESMGGAHTVYMTYTVKQQEGIKMDTLLAFAKCEAAVSSGAKSRVFDWDAAADYMKKRNIQNARAGLQSDLEWTGGPILIDGKIPEESTTYLSSVWAIPVLVIDDEEIPFWRWREETAWDAETFWPDSAKKIMGF